MVWARKKNEDGLRCALMRAIPYTRRPLDYWNCRVPAQKRNMWQMQWYYNEHFGQEPQPLNASIISKEAVVAIVKEILRQEGMGQEKAKEQIPTARLVEKPAAPVMLSTAQEVDDDPEMDDRTRSLIASTLSAFRSRG